MAPSLDDRTGKTLRVDRVLEGLQRRRRRNLLLVGKELRGALQVDRDVARVAFGAKPFRRGDLFRGQVHALLELAGDLVGSQPDLGGDGLGRGGWIVVNELERA